MGKVALQQFLGTWRVDPVFTYCQAGHRMWVVRPAEEPVATLLQHDENLAAVRPAPTRRPPDRGATIKK